MPSFSSDHEQPHQKSGVVLLFETSAAKKRPQICIFCGKTHQLQTFRGKTVCSACLHRISALFICG
ncbi:hypothetical protein [Desulfitobacterium sp.]|uniref:hypothetical protein n=1 Tax=Desulfitobacterium sp. TaxID=49981 RepID=UPI002C732F92|nr:hypothetical protein [Desulfitobacterium sp.]HVJ50138.1 hypothetical protein [Desulfitobacterium sp.]